MARRRKARTAKQRAAFRKMIAGLRRYKKRSGRARRASNPHRKRRRRRNPSVAITRTKGTSTMARRRRRRRRPATIIRVSNPRRRHRRRRRNPGRRVHHRRRRRNPGMGGSARHALGFTLRAVVPALAGGAIAGLADAKFLGDKSAPVQIGGKLLLAAGAALLFRRSPIVAASLMGGIVGPVGSSLAARLNGGVQTSSAAQTMRAMGMLIREDPYAARAMSALVDTSGRPISTPSLHGLGAGTALPDYPIGADVNLG